MSIKKIQLIHVAQKAMARINRFSKQVYLWVPTSVNCVEDQQTLKNIRLAKFPQISHFFNQHDSFLGRHENATLSKN